MNNWPDSRETSVADLDDERDAQPSRWAFIPDWFRKLSWFVVAASVLMVGNAECGIPLDKFNRPQQPLADKRRNYVIVLALGLPGAVWGVWRAATRKQRRPWGDWD
jgi:hypothetical protein